MGLNVYLTFHDAVIARLLIAAGDPDQARDRLDMSLRHAEETDALRGRRAVAAACAHLQRTHQRRTALDDALAYARKQGATLFELRCLLDYFDLLGEGDRATLAEVVGRLPGDSRLPERARAERILS